MPRFEYFDHTADTLFRAYGADFSEALANAILAVYNVIVDTSTVKSLERRSFTVEAQRQESLIYDVFEELLFLVDTESFLCHEVLSCSVTERDGRLFAEVDLAGDTRAQRYDVFGQVKAPTYSEMLLGEEDGKFFIQAVLDI